MSENYEELTAVSNPPSYWLSVGAQPSRPVAQLLGQVFFLKKKFYFFFNLSPRCQLKAGVLPPAPLKIFKPKEAKDAKDAAGGSA